MHSIPASEVVHRRGAKRDAALPPAQVLQVTVVLRPLNPEAHEPVVRLPGWHPAMFAAPDRAELEQRYDPGEKAFARVEQFANNHGLRVVGRSRVRHDVVLEGPTVALEAAFGVALHRFESEAGSYHAHDGPVRIPPDLASAVDGVLGLDSVPLHTPRAGLAGIAPKYTPGQLAEHYRFPTHDASALTIGLLQFGGGYHREDLSAFAQRLGLSLPPIRDIEVPGGSGTHGRNAPLSADEMKRIAIAWRKSASLGEFAKVAGQDFNGFLGSMEVTMDLELAAALGGGASVAVYFAPPGTDGWRRALYEVIGEGYPGGSSVAPRPSVLSVSWSECECAFGAEDLRLIHNALTAVARKGVSIVCSTGDWGSAGDWHPDVAPPANAHFPASSPAVIACGGTTLVERDGSTTDLAWNGKMLGVTVASGGGMSGFFPRPAFQNSLRPLSAHGTWLAPSVPAAFSGRWLPDVAANAAFESGVHLVVGGQDLAGGGTSAATPLWASLLVRIQAALGHPLAGLNHWLYHQGPASGCRDVVSGNNDITNGKVASYQAGPGWDPCTGFGTPDGEALLARLREHPTEDST